MNNLLKFIKDNLLIFIILILFCFILILVKNKLVTIYMRNKHMKVVVFDLDETLGHFVQLGIFSDILEKLYKRKLTQNEFFELMDIFPEFIRPNILKILSYLKNKKQKGQCNKVLIYTNNQGPKEWTIKIKNYFEKKINYKLFDQVIGAYKVHNKIIEPSRTTHDKTSRDLLNTANLPENAKICFLDDLYHPLMDNDNTYYINVDPYSDTLFFNEMARRYYNNNKNKLDINESDFINYVIKESNMYKYHVKHKTTKQINDDIEIGKEILNQLMNFFKIYKKRKTRRYKQKNNITRKIYY